MTQVIQTEFITASDLIPYQNHSIPYGPIGEIVDTRTYLRWLPGLQRRETALERWQRVINYNLNLAYDQHSYQWLRDEGLLMLDKFVNLKADVSGRTKWVGGTESSLNNPQSNFNCSFSIINRLSVFGEIFGLLMNGCGVGFRLFNDDIKNLPKVTNKITLKFDEYQPFLPEMREEHTYYYFEENTKYIEVGDSKQGWIDALNQYLDVITSDDQEAGIIHFNLDSIRPLGERIKGFGGTASGPNALKGIIEDINRIVNESSEVLRSIDCMDIVCAIAKGVVAGSSRRSALISLFEQGDTVMSNAKVGLYTSPELSHKAYRSQSNNTVCLSSKPTLDEIKNLLNTCRTEGEPGFNNYSKMVQKRVDAAKKYRPENPISWYTNVGTNPCHEIILSGGKDGDSVSFCNLTTLPLPNFVYSLDGVNLFDMTEYEESLRLNTRISMRQTCVEFDNTKWSETQSDERLLGVSMTGCQDMFSMMGWETGCEEINTFLKLANEFANDEADRYSKVLEIPRPLLVTSIKPEGTSSTIYGTSSGLHWDWAPYYIRRVRMTSKDALAVTLLNQGFIAYPELYDLSRLFDDPSLTDWDRLAKFSNLAPIERLSYLKQCSTVVFEFPCKSNSLQTQEDISAIEQLESLRAFTNVYTDHMPSSTISIKDDEWDNVAEWIDKNWNEYITASFFPYYGGAYPLLPLEAITQNVYDQMISKIPSSNIKVLPSGKVTFTVDHDLLTEVERSIGKLTDEDLGSDCAKGVCPIR